MLATDIAEAFSLHLTCHNVTSNAGGAFDTITLDSEARHRRRVRMTTDGGTEFLLDLPKAVLLNDGAGLALSDGRIVRVCAAAEPLLEVRGRDARHLNALAWQIGNRHLAAQIEADRILIAQDRVIAQMLVGLGAEVRDVKEPFSPEGGAYGDHAHSHSHGHSHDHHHG